MKHILVKIYWNDDLFVLSERQTSWNCLPRISQQSNHCGFFWLSWHCIVVTKMRVYLLRKIKMDILVFSFSSLDFPSFNPCPNSTKKPWHELHYTIQLWKIPLGRFLVQIPLGISCPNSFWTKNHYLSQKVPKYTLPFLPSSLRD